MSWACTVACFLYGKGSTYMHVGCKDDRSAKGELPSDCSSLILWYIYIYRSHLPTAEALASRYFDDQVNPENVLYTCTPMSHVYLRWISSPCVFIWFLFVIVAQPLSPNPKQKSLCYYCSLMNIQTCADCRSNRKLMQVLIIGGSWEEVLWSRPYLSRWLFFLVPSFPNDDSPP